MFYWSCFLTFTLFLDFLEYGSCPVKPLLSSNSVEYNVITRNFAKWHRNFMEFCEISYFCRILWNFELMRNFAEILYREICFPTSHSLYNSIEHIKLKFLSCIQILRYEISAKFRNILQNLREILSWFRIHPTLHVYIAFSTGQVPLTQKTLRCLYFV
jgi:hypothetical protein